MAPRHLTGPSAEGIRLIIEVIFALKIDEAIGVVHPSDAGMHMVKRPIGINRIRLLLEDEVV